MGKALPCQTQNARLPDSSAIPARCEGHPPAPLPLSAGTVIALHEPITSGGRDMIIAVDGPAASGKGTLAAGLARHYELPHLDTGLLYRAVGLAVADGDRRGAGGAVRLPA